MKQLFLPLMTAIFFFFGVDNLKALTGVEILARMDDNRQYKTLSCKGVMEIHIKGKKRLKTMLIKGMVDGEKSLVEFFNIEDEGTKYLMLGRNLWIYFPEEEDVVKISGHMLKEGMMGSDVSYEDALENDLLSDRYHITVSGEEPYNAMDCYVIVLEAKVKNVPYYKRIMYVGKDDFVGWKEEMYAKSGKLLKVAKVLKVQQIGGRNYAVKSEMSNKLRKNSKTIFELTNITFDEKFPADLFTMRHLRK